MFQIVTAMTPQDKLLSLSFSPARDAIVIVLTFSRFKNVQQHDSVQRRRCSHGNLSQVYTKPSSFESANV